MPPPVVTGGGFFFLMPMLEGRGLVNPLNL